MIGPFIGRAFGRSTGYPRPSLLPFGAGLTIHSGWRGVSCERHGVGTQPGDTLSSAGIHSMEDGATGGHSWRREAVWPTGKVSGHCRSWALLCALGCTFLSAFLEALVMDPWAATGARRGGVCVGWPGVLMASVERALHGC